MVLLMQKLEMKSPMIIWINESLMNQNAPNAFGKKKKGLEWETLLRQVRGGMGD